KLRAETWAFLREAAQLKQTRPQDKIVLLTHIPFHKEPGLCVDAPDIQTHWDDTIIEQTMLTPDTTQWILNNLRPDFVLNGHDHYGCDVTHIRAQDHTSWTAYPSSSSSSSSTSTSSSSSSSASSSSSSHQEGILSVREVTQRSMMAEYGGYSGLFEVRVAPSSPLGQQTGQLDFYYTACGFLTDVQVWIVIVTDLILVGLWSLVALYRVIAGKPSPHDSAA
ncbi:hypothetical protein BGZ98_006195, partial [Dissophora globulifera]